MIQNKYLKMKKKERRVVRAAKKAKEQCESSATRLDFVLLCYKKSFSTLSMLVIRSPPSLLQTCPCEHGTNLALGVSTYYSRVDKRKITNVHGFIVASWRKHQTQSKHCTPAPRAQITNLAPLQTPWRDARILLNIFFNSIAHSFLSPYPALHKTRKCNGCF